ncbi:MAG: chemotaxis protein CheB [Candidatus Obscuribacterales bacterium]|nr:chemotaxis protein CheB [Candidatus Obscuribacterales bacterium]
MIRVLVADDSLTSRQRLVQILRTDKEIEIIGEADNGAEAAHLTRQLSPDLLLMDIYMPGMDGLETTSLIMHESPLPIVLISGMRTGELVIEALNRGALAVLEKPKEDESGHLSAMSMHLPRVVHAIASMKLKQQMKPIKPQSNSKTYSTCVAEAEASMAKTAHPHNTNFKPEIVAIASSVGGPGALEIILNSLPGNFSLPILVTQHISKGFVFNLAEWLDRVTDLTVKVARHGEMLEAGNVYVAPDSCHLGVGTNGEIYLSQAPPIKGFQPSCTHMFQSVAEHYGARTLAVILTGMGDDGVAGLQEVKKKGGIIIAQDMSTSIVFGMPGNALALKLPDYLLPVDAIAKQLIECLS